MIYEKYVIHGEILSVEIRFYDRVLLHSVYFNLNVLFSKIILCGLVGLNVCVDLIELLLSKYSKS